MTTKKILVPDLGGAESVAVIEIAVAQGDRVEKEQPLVVLESDKATMEVPSTHAGVVKEILVKEDDTVKEGSPIVELEIDESASDAEEDESEPEPEPEPGQEENASQDTQTEDEPEVKKDVKKDVKKAPRKKDVAAKDTKTTDANTAQPKPVAVPDIGSDEKVEVIELSVQVGDTVAEGDSLVVLESDKATMDVPAPFAGEVTEFKVSEGDKVATGDAIAMVRASGAGSEAPAAEKDEKKHDKKDEKTAAANKETQNKATEKDKPEVPSKTVSQPSAKAPESEEAPAAVLPGAEAHAGPAVRQLARELGVDLSRVPATGPRNRVLKDDVHAYVKSAMQPQATGVGAAAIPVVPPVDFSQFGAVEKIKMSKIQRLTAANMQRSWLNVPHVTQFDDADITELDTFRASLKAETEKRGIKVTPVSFLIKAVAVALQENPEFNRSLDADGEHFVQKKYIHIGMAVDTPRGLVVPVIRDADQKGIWQLSQEVRELATKAREGKLTAAEMQGGCFTISSLGAIGGTGFTPIVNTPEVGILGVSKADIRPVWNGSEFTPRQMLPLALSYDHRAVNGADAGRFMTTLVALLGDIRRLVM